MLSLINNRKRCIDVNADDVKQGCSNYYSSTTMKITPDWLCGFVDGEGSSDPHLTQTR